MPRSQAIACFIVLTIPCVVSTGADKTNGLDRCPGYIATNVRFAANGLNATLQLAGEPCNAYGPDISELTLTVRHEEATRLHVKISDVGRNQYEVPESVLPRPASDGVLSTDSAIQFEWETSPFSFNVIRTSTKEVLFAMAGPLVFEPQYLRIATFLPQDANIYGLGEHTETFRLPLNNLTRTLWNRNSYAIPQNSNLYGSHPVYFEHSIAGTHGVFLLNSNGMDVKSDGNILEYHVIGGVLDLYFLAGSSSDPEEVTRQYAKIVGSPAEMPYWSFGLHQCRYGYQNFVEVAEVISNYAKAGIPLETMWTDIDVMHDRWTFTNDEEYFPTNKMREIVEYLHSKGQRYITMVDPAVAAVENKGYGAYERGKELGIWLTNPDGTDHLGLVWPGATTYPDWFHPRANEYWTSEFMRAFDPAAGIDIDGAWIDMNEPTSFCDWPCPDPYGSAMEQDLPPTRRGPAPDTDTPIFDESAPKPDLLYGAQMPFMHELPGDHDNLDAPETFSRLLVHAENGSGHRQQVNDTVQHQEVHPVKHDNDLRIVRVKILYFLLEHWLSNPRRGRRRRRKPFHGKQWASVVEQWYADIIEWFVNWRPRNVLEPPYRIANTFGSLSSRTAFTDVIHANGLSEYDTHNLYGSMMSTSTRLAMLARRPGLRPFIITRSTFAGDGRNVGKWLGDNLSTWEHYRFSIAGMLGMASIYQMPMVGSDVCGFGGNTTEELCARWATLGAFYPFMRNHNNNDSIPQEFYRWPSVATAAQKALGMRYRLLDYLYTAFHQARLDGTPVLSPMFFKYPKDPQTFAIDTQFFFGPSILVSPVTQEGSNEAEIYLPDDIFYDIHTLTPVHGTGSTVTFRDIGLADIPVHIRGGSIVPLRIHGASTTEALRKVDFEVIVAPDLDGRATGSLYLDDGISISSKQTMMVFRYEDRTLNVSVTRREYEAKANLIRIRFAGMDEQPGTVEIDSEVSRTAEVRYKRDARVLIVDTKVSVMQGFAVKLDL